MTEFFGMMVLPDGDVVQPLRYAFDPSDEWDMEDTQKLIDEKGSLRIGRHLILYGERLARKRFGDLISESTGDKCWVRDISMDSVRGYRSVSAAIQDNLHQTWSKRV